MSQVIDSRIDSNSRVFFIKGERTAIYDTGAPGNERKILRALREAGIPQAQVSVIIVSHAHWDHCGSLQALKAALKVPVMLGWPDAEFMAKGENILPTNFTARSKEADTTGPKFESVTVEVVAREDMSLDKYGIDAWVITTPGHTEGSLSVLSSNGDCATGDFLAGLYTGEQVAVERSMKKLKALGAKRFLPAHGVDIDAEKLFRTFFMPDQ
jgi:hydroxyacylglutathione hydrolase